MYYDTTVAPLRTRLYFEKFFKHRAHMYYYDTTVAPIRTMLYFENLLSQVQTPLLLYVQKGKTGGTLCRLANDAALSYISLC